MFWIFQENLYPSFLIHLDFFSIAFFFFFLLLFFFFIINFIFMLIIHINLLFDLYSSSISGRLLLRFCLIIIKTLAFFCLFLNPANKFHICILNWLNDDIRDWIIVIQIGFGIEKINECRNSPVTCCELKIDFWIICMSCPVHLVVSVKATCDFWLSNEPFWEEALGEHLSIIESIYGNINKTNTSGAWVNGISFREWSFWNMFRCRIIHFTVFVSSW